MAKLTKNELKLHEQALRLLEKDVLTYDDKHFVLDNWHEGATHVNSAAGAYFTPHSIAAGVAIEANGLGWDFVDLCAGIGRLAFTVSNYLNPFGREDKKIRMTCVEINKAYIEVGKKIMPNARWIQADVLELPADIGRFDCAIGNPPFGVSLGAKKASPRLKTGAFEYKVIDVASDLAKYGVFIIPQGSAPFKISGGRTFEENPSRDYDQFVERTGIVLEANCGIDTTVGGQFRGTKILTEIVVVDFMDAIERRNPVPEPEEPELELLAPVVEPKWGDMVQGELFPWAA